MHHARCASRGPGPAMCRGAMRGGHPFHHRAGPPARHASFFQPGPPFAAFGPPARGDFFGPRGGDFAPLFRFMDDGIRALEGISRDNAWPFGAVSQAQQQKFNPRFDIKETEHAYELRGELPGVAAENVEVAFTDNQTLTIKGHTQRETSQGNPPQQAVEQSTEQTSAAEVNDTASDTASTTGSYVKPSVEDEDAPAQTPTTETEQAESSAQAESKAAAEAQPSAEDQASTEQQRSNEHYWYSERSVGTFARTFTFPSRVAQEGVTASLKNGILEMVVPKDTSSQARRINIE